MRSLIPAESWEYSLRDFVCGASTALAGRREYSRIHIEGIGNCIPVRSGRAALVVALKALNLKDGARIGVPLYSCPVVFKAVKEAGCTPVFVDIERDTFCISAKDLSKKIKKVDALIVIHMFGNLCEMHGLMDAAIGKPIIEDCAQSLGSKINGQMAGTIGTIGIFSFRSGKYLSVGEGGALFSKDEEIKSRLLSIVSSLKIPSKSEEVKHIFKTYLRAKLRTRPLFGMIGKKIWQRYNRTVDFSAKTPIILSQILFQDLRLVIERLRKSDQAIAIQRANAEQYLNSLKSGGNMVFVEKPDTFYNRYAFPVVFPSVEHRDIVADYLFERKIDTIKPYQDIPEIASEYYEYLGDCPVTEKLSKRILIIPSYHTLDNNEIEYIADRINDIWERANWYRLNDSML